MAQMLAHLTATRALSLAILKVNIVVVKVFVVTEVAAVVAFVVVVI